MANGTVERSPRLKARIAGVLYVIIIALALFAPFPVAPSWLLRGDVSATLTKILASKSLYSLGGVAELIVYARDLGVALIFTTASSISPGCGFTRILSQTLNCRSSGLNCARIQPFDWKR